MPRLYYTFGYFRSGLPYNRIGHGSKPLVVFQGLSFEHKPLSGVLDRVILGMYRFLEHDYTVYSVARKPGLPRGYSIHDMAQDYAAMIVQEFGGPVDMIGTSTGGSIVQHFAADYPGLVRRLVIHSSAYTLGEVGKQAQLEIGRLAGRRKWRQAYGVSMRFLLPRNALGSALAFIGSVLMSFSAPQDPSDLVITVEAEDAHDFYNRLHEIQAPTLVVAGDRDPFYTAELFRETAAGIPGARLILYPGMGHPASGPQYERDVLAFLREGRSS
ncbi:MAG: alpha/beta fold hydrolase [Anaerolineae bacterium]